MRKLFANILMGILLLSTGVCLAGAEEYVNNQNYYKPTLIDKIGDSTSDFAESVGDATVDAVHTTGVYIKDKSKTAASATNKAVKTGAKKAGHAAKEGAKITGHAVKSNAKKATNWSAKKIRNGAEKVIIKTETVNETSNQEIPQTEK